MTNTPWPRRPVELTQHRRNGCVTCMVAQLMYVFRRTDAPNLRQIDRAMGYDGSGAAMLDIDAYYYLVREGFRYVAIDGFEPRRFITEGVNYLREQADGRWSGMFSRFYSAKKVAELQRLMSEHALRMQPYASRARDIMRLPNLNDVTSLLRQGCVVDITLITGVQPVQHAGLLVPMLRCADASRVWLYEPDYHRKTVRTVTLAKIESRILFENGITAVWR